jgi:uncharacterized surface protein with fasciclin (FAS1) repeats
MSEKAGQGQPLKLILLQHLCQRKKFLKHCCQADIAASNGVIHAIDTVIA